MIVFAGPSIADVERSPGLDFRPPAKQGDIYLATLERPSAIGLIDGYFEGVPAVWHKEILWSLTIGIPVLGASSMGALRAAELDRYGMCGIGKIYEAFRDGLYEDDDEVALHHAPAALNFAPLTVPMVDIRATLAAAVTQSIATSAEAQALLGIAKSLHYGDRKWERIVRGADTDLQQRLERWLPENYVDQKRLDAELLIATMLRGDLYKKSASEIETFNFEETRLWHRATLEWENTCADKSWSSEKLMITDDDRWRT